MKWGRWSTTASSNSTTPPDGWPEGQLPSTVNDCAREMMAQIKAGISDVQFIDLDLSPTQTGSTTFTVPGNQMAFLEYGRRIKCAVGASTLYGTVYSSTATTNTGVSLRLDTGVLTGSLSAISIGFPSLVNTAHPMGDATHSGPSPFVNNQFEIWQVANSFSFTAVQAQFTADHWIFASSASAGGGMCYRAERSASATFVPTVAQAGVVLNSSLRVSISATLASPAAGNYMVISHHIEGQFFRPMAQKPTTISFWAWSTKTGTYCCAMQNGVGDRSVVLEYALSAASTWERKTLTFPKSPSAGTWNYSEGAGLIVTWPLVAGTSNQGGAGNWTAAGIIATSNQTNLATSAGNAFMLAGVHINEGVHADPIPVYVPDIEYNRARRYCRVIGNGNNYRRFRGMWNNGVNSAVFADFEPPLRSAATEILFPALSTLVVYNAVGLAYSVSAIATTVNEAGGVEFAVQAAGVPAPAPTTGSVAILTQVSATGQIIIRSEI